MAAKQTQKDETRQAGRLTLITGIGERKYLTAAERARFLDALSILDNAQERSFCAMLFWTGCRPSEALALRALHIDLDECTIIIRSLKKRGAERGRSFRSVPIPPDFAAALENAHGVRAAQANADGGASSRLWTFSRTTAWKRVRVVMEQAGLSGVRASGRGLRHGYGVHAAMSRVPETRIKKWLGHADLSTTEIYLDIAGDEDRAIAARMWRDGATETTINEKETV